MVEWYMYTGQWLNGTCSFYVPLYSGQWLNGTLYMYMYLYIVVNG